MKIDVRTLRTLYRTKKITTDGVKEALDRGWITVEEYNELMREIKARDDRSVNE